MLLVRSSISCATSVRGDLATFSLLFNLGLAGDLLPLGGGEGLGALDRGTEGAVDDELGQDTNGAGHAKEDGVEAGLVQAVVLEQNARVRVNVGVRVLGLAVLRQDARRDLVHLADELEHRVVRHLLLREFALRHVPWVRLAEDGVAVAGHDAARVQRGPQVVRDSLVAEVVANGLLHLGKPVQDFLVSKTVQGTGETVQTGGEGQEGRAKSGADEVGGVSADVATLVVGVDGQVETHQLNEVGVAAEAELVGEVEAVVLVLLDRGDLASLEDVLVDARGDGGKLGDQIHRVLKGVSPVVLLVDTLGVGLGKGRGVFEGGNGEGELSHGVQVGRAAVDELLDELGHIGSGGPFGREIANLLLSRDLAGQEKPEDA